MVDWVAEALIAALSFGIGAFLTYGITREKMKTKAFEEARRLAMSMLKEMYENERREFEENLRREYEKKFEEWKIEYMKKRESPSSEQL
ncbi:MAG: hypothetical protein NDF54_12060 [archaeon GB-1867-035]|nr:hypothetical protein [Candidatus Culexmicrobium profundum]